MHGRGPAARGHRAGQHSYSGSIGQKAQLTNAYQELGRELASTQIKTVGNYTLGRVVGEGSFGKVRLAVHKLTSQRCAIKQIPRTAAPPMLTREIHHHRRLHHPNVLQLYEVIATEANIWLVSELCAGGELFDYLVEQGRLTETEAKRIFGQLCLGVGYIHSQGVVHRDLKLENVLLDERCNVKIADFGFGREYEQRRLMETFCGTTGYAAPEMLAGEKYLGEEVDIWSLGIILYSLLTGSLPFDDDDEDIMKSKILVGDFDIPNWLSEESQDLLANILRKDPRQRLSIRSILGHSWYTNPTSTFNPMPDYFVQQHYLEQSIPEESLSSSPPQMLEGSISGETAHQAEPSATESVTSTASWHSAASTVDSEADITARVARSGRSDTPISSDEAEDGTEKHDAAYEHHPQDSADQQASNRGYDSFKIPRNPSQSTITRSDSRRSISRQHMRPSPRLPGGESPAQHFRFPHGSPALIDPFGQVSPSLPMQAHSRTPSRTKRRSIGSTMSERLGPNSDEPSIDYVALLDRTNSACFTTAVEKTLLESLSTLGFDTGQITHSVSSDACDASGAIWWMLKLRAEQREQERQDANDSLAGEGASLPMALTPTVPQFAEADTAKPQEAPQMNVIPPQKDAKGEIEALQYGQDNHIESPRRPRIQVPGSARPSISAPLLATRGTASLESGAANLSADFSSASTSPAREGGLSTTSFSREMSQSPRSPTNKPRSASVSTVSMLQRATSALGVKKDKTDDKEATSPFLDSGRSTPGLLSGGFFGRKTSGSSIPAARPSMPAQRDSTREEKAASSGSLVEVQSGQSSEGHSTTPRPGVTPPPAAYSREADLTRQHAAGSPSSRSTTSRDTRASTSSQMRSSPDTLRSSTASDTGLGTSPSGKARASKNFFSTFKMWFNEDKRKHRRSRPQSNTQTYPAGQGTNGSVRRPYIHAPSPLQRPPIARMPSAGAASAVVMSRRNSSTSARRVTSSEHPSPLLGHHTRRRSDASRHSFNSGNGARTPTSDRDHSRPPSAQSGIPVSADVYNAARKRHARASSSSSAGSRHSTMISGSPVATYRRTPAVTQVRRISTPKNRFTHSRNASNPSSAHSASSRRSSVSVLVEGEETIIEEENENMEDSKELARSKALRKLSGDAEKLPESAPLTEAAVAAVDAMSDQAAQPSQSSSRKPSDRDAHEDRQHHGHRRASSTSSGRGPSVFVAHKVVNPFGTPNGSHFQAGSHSYGRSKRDSDKPKLRDVFKAKAGANDDAWVDEDDGMYTGGFGQISTRNVSTAGSRTADPPAGTPTASRFPSSLGTGGGHRSTDGGEASGMTLGEGRYAGMSRSECAPSGVGGSRQRPPVKGPVFKRSATVVEEEEEEEE